MVFATGWGMDTEPFSLLSACNFDIFLLYDYNSIEEISLVELKKQYRQLHLMAWSMGVWVAAFLFAQQKELFASTTALNGTLRPIDDSCGISKKDFDIAIDTFSSASLENFYKSMFTSQTEHSRFLENRPKRSQQSILHELVSLKKMYLKNGPASDIYDNKIVGSKDRIFPARNQIRAWGREQCSTLKVPHFPFFQWNNITLQYQENQY